MNKPDHTLLFVSYAHVNRFLVEQLLIKPLEIYPDYDVWYDDRILPGDKWEERIFSTIKSSDVMLFAVSPEAIASEWCRRELSYAQQNNIFVIPVLIQSNMELPPELARLQYVDFTEGAFPKNLKKLATAISERKRGRMQPTESPPGEPLQENDEADEVDTIGESKATDEANKADTEGGADAVDVVDAPETSPLTTVSPPATTDNPPPTETKESLVKKFIAVITVIATVVTICSVLNILPSELQNQFWCFIKVTECKTSTPISGIPTSESTDISITSTPDSSNPTSTTIPQVETETATPEAQSAVVISEETTTETAIATAVITPTDVSSSEDIAFDILYEGPNSISIHIVEDTNLQGIVFDTGDQQYRLEDLFHLLKFTEGKAVAGECYRFIRAGSTSPLATQCKASQTTFVQLAQSDIFWHDSTSGMSVAFEVKRDDKPLGICSFNPNKCSIKSAP